MKIDSHQHFWRFDPVRDAWIDDSMQVLRRDFLPDDLAPALKANAVDYSIAVQADQSEAETEFLLQLADNNDWICAVVGWVDLRAENIEQRLRHFSSYKKLRGFRHIVQAEKDTTFMLRDDFQRGIALLQRHGFCYDILVYPEQLPAAVQLAAAFPQQTFVLDHIAKPPIKVRGMQPWTNDIRRLAKNKNVYCKVSGLVTEADLGNWRSEDITPYLDVVLEAFGAQRLMFGSDWPVCLLAGSYEQVLALVDDYSAGLSAAERGGLFGANAARAYSIDTTRLS